MRRGLLCGSLQLLLAGFHVVAAEGISFHRQIQPILERRCQGCHSAENPAANLALTSYEKLLEGGASGTALVAGKPDQSPLIQFISGEKPRMPKGGLPLTASEVSLIQAWISEGAKDDTPPAAYFEQHVSHIFEQNCLRCHNDEKKTSGLSLASRSSALAGGRRGPAVVPGHPEQGSLLSMLSGPKPAMPRQSEPLSRVQITAIRKWIEQGAVWPENRKLAEQAGPGLWWSLKPIRTAPVPDANSEWVRTPIDAFILASLKEKGLETSPQADRRSLIRRLTYDLHGLPPAPDDVDAFVADRAPDAYEKLVDRLLSSPRYGERWGRHWLDVVHYGESHGYDRDKPRLHAWPYRDYVIRSFNEDKPYARFVKEQLAGDVLSPGDPDGVIATGFIAAGPWDYVGQVELREGTLDKKITRNLDRDDMVATTMNTFVSLTVQCSRCHDHKFDPFTQKEFYRLYAFFNNIPERGLDGNKGNAMPFIKVPTPEQEKRLAALRSEIEALTKKLAGTLPDVDAAQVAWEKEPGTAKTEWKPLELTKLRSKGGATFTTDKDGSTVVGGPVALTEVYTFTFRTALPRLTAIRIEALPDDRLEGKGPGRSVNGNFVLTGIRISLGDGKDSTPLKIRSASADFFQKEGAFDIKSVLQKGGPGWAILPETGKGAVRLSVGRFTTEDEVDRAAALLVAGMN